MTNLDERAYMSDPYRREFKARVREVEDAGGEGTAVYLDTTYFYPVSGGQPDDRGTLGGLAVTGITEDGRGVRHLVEGTLEAGAEVEGRIDWGRRFDHMQQHSGQHLLSRVFLDDAKLSTVGFHLGDRTCTIDLDGEIAADAVIPTVEEKVNDLIWKDSPIAGRIVGRDEYERLQEEQAAKMTVRTRLPGEVDRVRLVEIEDVDVTTCCGTHCRSSGEIGLIKVLGTERVRGGARVEFVCGGRALRDYSDKHALVSALALRFTTEWQEVAAVVGKTVDENRELRKAQEALRRELSGFRAADLAGPVATVGGVEIIRTVMQDEDAGSAREMAMKLRDGGTRVVLFGIAGAKPALLFACSPGLDLDMGDMLRRSVELMGGRGGGGKDFAQGGGGDVGLLEEALDGAVQAVREALE